MRRLHERGEVQARSARPRVLAAADRALLPWFRERTEAARAAIGGSVSAPAGSVEIHR
jgi:hypothetical protein